MDITTLRALQDKVYDKRKHAAFLLEAQIKDHISKNELDKVNQILSQLSSLALNSNPSWRWGGVMGLAACSIALGHEIPNHLIHIVPPIISCFSDADSKVRYFSCESMYNVAKVAKGEILIYFNELFDALSKLAADPDPAVKNGAELLDRLIKDIVTEQAATYISVIPNHIRSTRQSINSSSSIVSMTNQPMNPTQPSFVSSPQSQLQLERAFSLEDFIPLLRERIYNFNPFTRQYLVSWLQLLNSIPEINLVSHLPDFLDGLLKYLVDAGSDIQLSVQQLLADLLIEIDKVVHANEFQEKQRLHKKHLKLHRKMFERQMEEGGGFDRRPSPIQSQPELITESPQAINSQSISPDMTISHQVNENTEVSSPLSRATTINPNNLRETITSPQEIKSQLDRGFEDEVEDDEDAELGTYVQGQGVELDLPAIVLILINWMHCHESCEETQATCLRWLNELIHIDESILIPFTPNLIPIILTGLSHRRYQVKELANEVNTNLSRAIENLPTPTPPVQPTITPVPSSSNEKKEKSKLNHPSSHPTQERSRSKNPTNDRSLSLNLNVPSSSNTRKRPQPNQKIPEEPLSRSEELPIRSDQGQIEEEVIPDPFDYFNTVNNLTLQFLNPHEETRLAALRWLIMLHQKVPDKILTLEDGTFPALLKTLSDESELVIRSDLQLLSQISLRSLSVDQDGVYYSHFMLDLLNLFGTDRDLLETRGNLIVRVLCQYLNPERIYKTFGEHLEKDEDLEFASLMVQNLNLIMITSPELSEMRKKLKQLETKDNCHLFINLYRSFSHNPISTLTLCLLTPVAYEHAFNLLSILANDMEITVGLLIQVDKLVQLLESPIFTSLRLQLLEPDKYPFLYKALYGILMLLPQSSAFATLRNRLGAVSTLGYAHAIPKTTNSNLTINNSRANKNMNKPNESITEQIPWNSLLLHFKTIQNRHEKVRRQQNENLISGRDDLSSSTNLIIEDFNQNPIEEQFFDSNQLANTTTTISKTPENSSPTASSIGILPHSSPSTLLNHQPNNNHTINSHHRFNSTSNPSQPQPILSPTNHPSPTKIPSPLLSNQMRKKSQASMKSATGMAVVGLPNQPVHLRKPSGVGHISIPMPVQKDIGNPKSNVFSNGLKR